MTYISNNSRNPTAYPTSHGQFQGTIQAGILNWGPFGKKPSCPDPKNFYAIAMKTAAAVVMHLQQAQSCIAIDNISGFQASLLQAKRSFNYLKRQIKDFKNDWKKCGTKEPLPQQVIFAEKELEEAKKLLDASNLNSMSNAVSWQNAATNIGSILKILGGLGSLLNPLNYKQTF